MIVIMIMIMVRVKTIMIFLFQASTTRWTGQTDLLWNQKSAWWVLQAIMMMTIFIITMHCNGDDHDDVEEEMEETCLFSQIA